MNKFEMPGRTPHNSEQIHPEIERAYDRARKTLQENAISLSDFEGLYDPKNLERDRERVKEREAYFQKSLTHNEVSKHYSDVLEAIFFDQISNGSWFGENTQAIKTSSFDDYYNGADIILELEDTARTLAHLSLSIDVTFGTTKTKEKMAGIKERIDKGTLGRINYFKSSRSGDRGEKSNLPQVVIGVEKDMIIELADLWMNSTGDAGAANPISGHPVKRLILSEILLQLHTFRTYAKEIGHVTLVPIYEKDIMILEDILREQGMVDISKYRNDRVFMAIKDSLSIFKQK